MQIMNVKMVEFIDLNTELIAGNVVVRIVFSWSSGFNIHFVFWKCKQKSVEFN